LNVLDLFCGAAGGGSAGLERAGCRTVAACEIDPWRRAVFGVRHPGTPTGPRFPAGMRNRAIAALGDAVVAQITEAIGRAMTAEFFDAGRKENA